jgi:ribonuclease HI
MPWAATLLRGQKVWARVSSDGAFVDEGGRVEIRYKQGDSKAYRAATRNLEKIAGGAVLADEAIVAALPDVDGASGTGAPKSGKKKGAKDHEASQAEARRAMPEGSWLAYADGACSGNPGPAGLGLVLIAPSGATQEGYEYLGVGTNNVAELTAILRAVEHLPKEAPGLLVHTDSQYSIGVLSKGWKAKANQDLVAKVKSALTARKTVRLTYVPGHAGDAGNERADELARDAVRLRASRFPV